SKPRQPGYFQEEVPISTPLPASSEIAFFTLSRSNCTGLCSISVFSFYRPTEPPRGSAASHRPQEIAATADCPTTSGGSQRRRGVRFHEAALGSAGGANVVETGQITPAGVAANFDQA